MNDPQSNSMDRRSLVPVRTINEAPRLLRPAPPQVASNGITVGFVWQVFARWWTVVLPAGLLLGAGGAAVAWLTFQPTFVAEAWLRIEDRRPYVAFPSAEESKRFVETQVELIRSPIVLTGCLSRPEIAQLAELKTVETPMEWLSQRLGVTAVGQSELFKIKFEGPHPKNAASIANAVVESYLKLHTDNSETETQEIIAALEAEKTRRVHELERLQETVRTLTKQVTGKELATAGQKISDAPQQGNPLAALEDRLTTAEVNCEVLQARLEVARKKLTEKRQTRVPQLQLEQAIAADSGVHKLTSDLMEVELLLEEYDNTATKGKQLAAVHRLEGRKAGIEEALEKRRVEVRGLRTAEFEHGATNDQEDFVGRLDEELESQRREEQLLKDRIEKARGELAKSGDSALDLEFVRNEMRRAEEVFQRIADRITALRTEKSAPSRVSLIHAAATPSLPKTSPVKAVAGVGLGLFVLPLGLALLWEFRVRRISSGSEILQQTRMRVVGEITSLPNRPLMRGKRSNLRFQQQLSLFDESVAYLRTSLMLGEDADDLRVLAVTSAVSQEGKTTIAAQLAANIAKVSGQSTLLIDADLRAPSLHEVFGIPLDPGLAEVLSGEASLEEVIQSTVTGPVQLIPAGRLRMSAHTLFGNDNFQQILKTLRLQYRYIVIDCPPLLSASEALVVAKVADGTLLCAMRDVSQFSKVCMARDRLVAAGAYPLGVVLNDVPPRAYAARYGKYYAVVDQD